MHQVSPLLEQLILLMVVITVGLGLHRLEVRVVQRRQVTPVVPVVVVQVEPLVTSVLRVQMAMPHQLQVLQLIMVVAVAVASI